MMANINMFGSGRDGIGFRNDASTLVITENGERVRSRQFSESEEEFQPKGFFNSVGQSVIFRFS